MAKRIGDLAFFFGHELGASGLLMVRGVLVLSFLFSCAGSPEPAKPSTVHTIKNVPFYPQEDYQCGPASLAGVLNYWNIVLSPEEIAHEIYSDSARGTLNVDMILYAKKKGLMVKNYRGSIDDIKRNIDLKQPLIVMVDYGFWIYEQNHFMVVVGYDDTGILANSGKERLKYLPFESFLRTWRKTGFWTILISR